MCKHSECEKSSSCLRILAPPETDQIYMRFHNICSENNQYQWFWQAPDELIIKQEEVVGDIQ